MNVKYNECRIFIIILSIFFSLILGIGIFYQPYLNYVPDDGDNDFWEDRRLHYLTYDALLVTTTIDDRLRIRKVRDPCASPYELACGGWTGNGSYLHDNAMIRHAQRLHRAISHASSSHPWASTAFAQCMQQMVTPYDSASIGVIEKVLQEMEQRATSSDTVTANLQRLQSLAEHALFPLFLWQNNSAPFLEPSLWLSPWHPRLTKLACSISADSGNTNECIVAVDTLLATTQHFTKTPSSSSYSLSQWTASTRSAIPLSEGAVEHVQVWSDPNFQLLLRSLTMRSAVIFIRAAAVADMLLYVGLPDHHLQYGSVQFGADAAARHLLSTLERTHPPALYGWGAAGSALFLAEEGEEDDLHPSSTDSCLLALGDILPHVVARLIEPEPNITATVQSLFASLKKELIVKLDHSSMLKPSFIQSMRKRIGDMELWLEDGRAGVNESVLLQSRAFVDTALQARRFNWLRASNGSVRGDVGNFNFHAETLNAVYLPESNAIYLPPGLLLSPFLPRHGESLDVELLYARLGVIVAHEMAHSLNRFTLQKLRLASGEDFRLLSNMLKCFSNAIEHFEEKETYPDIVGVEIAYRACQRSKGCGSGEARNRFFLLYGQTMCSNRVHQDFEIHQTARERVNAAISMATDADGHGFGAVQWSCFEPPTCSF